MTGLPTLESRERRGLFPGTSDFDERAGRRAAPRRGYSWSFTGLLPIVRRPGCVAEPVTFLPCGEFQKGLQGIGVLVDPLVPIAQAREPRRHGGQREIGGIAVANLVPREGRRDACVGP